MSRHSSFDGVDEVKVPGTDEAKVDEAKVPGTDITPADKVKVR